MLSAPDAITRYQVNPALTGARNIHADGAEIARNQRVLEKRAGEPGKNGPLDGGYAAQ